MDQILALKNRLKAYMRAQMTIGGGANIKFAPTNSLASEREREKGKDLNEPTVTQVAARLLTCTFGQRKVSVVVGCAFEVK